MRVYSIFRMLLVPLLLTGPATKANEPVDLELVLAVDISGSIDKKEAQLQRKGYLQALVHPEIVAAIQRGPQGQIAVTYIEWAGVEHRRTVADWAVISDMDSARAFAATIKAAPLVTAFFTSISGVIEYAAPSFDLNVYEGIRRVIDISGDGPNNTGNMVTVARDTAITQGVTINGLAIINDRPGLYGWPPFADLDLYYEDCVIGGPGAFLLVTNFTEDFARAVHRKLLLEIAGRRPTVRPVLQYAAAGPSPRLWRAQARERPSCDSGERRLQDLIDD